jgi:hypothetical protein
MSRAINFAEIILADQEKYRDWIVTHYAGEGEDFGPQRIFYSRRLKGKKLRDYIERVKAKTIFWSKGV